jgi:cell division initiation protein
LPEQALSREGTAGLACWETSRDNGCITADELTKLIEERSLPTALRGYDRSATDDFLSKLEESVKSVLSERGEAQMRVAELERRIAESRENEKEITEALVVASRVRAESEREGMELKAKYTREAKAITAESKRKTDEIVRAAEAEAKKVLEAAKVKARELEQEIRDAEQLAVQTRAKLTTFLESLLAEIERGGDLGSAVDELFARAGDAAEDDRGGILR